MALKHKCRTHGKGAMAFAAFFLLAPGKVSAAPIIATEGIQIDGGTPALGRIYRSPLVGIGTWAQSGSFYDWGVFAVGGADMLAIPAGTNNLLLGSGSGTTTFPGQVNMSRGSGGQRVQVLATQAGQIADINFGQAADGTNRVSLGWGGNHAYVQTAGGVAPLSLQSGGGKVGIGTASPGYTLDVLGNAHISSTLGVAGHSTIGGVTIQGNAALFSSAANQIIYTDGSNIMKSSGNLAFNGSTMSVTNATSGANLYGIQGFTPNSTGASYWEFTNNTEVSGTSNTGDAVFRLGITNESTRPYLNFAVRRRTPMGSGSYAEISTNPGSITGLSELRLQTGGGSTLVGGILGVSGALNVAGVATVGNGTTFSNLKLNGALGNFKAVGALTNGSNRWWFGANSASESGADAGTNFVIEAYNDAGNLIDVPFSISRTSGGQVTVTRPLQVNGDATVNGNLQANTLIAGTVKATAWEIAEAPDYVFEKGYKLATLEKVESFVKENKHLPEVPSAKQMKQEGLDLVKMNFDLLKKVEELTLYAIEQNKEIADLKTSVRRLEYKVATSK